MKDYIEERAVEIAYYIIENKATVRQTAVAFGEDVLLHLYVSYSYLLQTPPPSASPSPYFQ